MAEIRSMDMGRFEQDQQKIAANSGLEFADVSRLVVTNNLPIRLIGDYRSNFEHFITLPTGMRPFYCDGPESDCPLCRLAAQFSLSDDPAKQDLAKTQIKAREKFYFNVLDRTPAGRVWHKTNKKSYLLVQNQKGSNIGSMLMQQFGQIVSMRKQQGQSYDPNGFDIILMKTGSGQNNTKYGAQFSGDTTPLTEEELAYEIWPLDQIARISSIADRQNAANFLMNGAMPETTPDININKMGAPGPVQMAQQPVQRPPLAPPPAQRPKMQPVPQQRPVVQPQQAPAVAPKLVLPAKQPAQPPVLPQGEFQDTRINPQTQGDSTMMVPCSNCGSEMQINLDDVRNLQCWNCQQVFAHPNAS